MHSRSQVAESMLDWRHKQPPVTLDDVVFASNPEANALVKENPFAFLLAASIDRLGKSFLIWNAPLQMMKAWGHLDPSRIAQMDIETLAASPEIAGIPSTARRTDLARTIVHLCQLIQESYGGDPTGFFVGNVRQIMSNLMRIYGVGPGLARMMIIQRLLYFGLEPEVGDGLLPKQDVHIRRVFLRTGLVDQPTENAIRAAVVGFDNVDIAYIDQVAWNIGVNYCHKTNPDCASCPIDADCPKLGAA